MAGSSETRPQDGDRFGQLIRLLDGHGARYRLLEHPAEGRTEIVSRYRGNPLAQAAKCVVLRVKLDRKTSWFVLAVVPGDTRVDFDAIKQLKQATYVGFADPDTAERLGGSVSGTILPFSFDPALELIVDHGVFEHQEIFFNAALLDRSVAMRSDDYAAIAAPRRAAIAKRE